MSATTSLPIVVSRFPTAFPVGPAYGAMEPVPWPKLTDEMRARRQGEKDGINLVFARFMLEPDGCVRRLKANALSRTAVALDIEAHKKTGEVPPPIDEAERRVRAQGWSAALYTSHSHVPGSPRYRIVIPLTSEIEPHLPAPEVVAEILGLSGVLDPSKLGAASVFYLPSASPGKAAQHQTVIVDGDPIDADWMRGRAGALLAAREAEQARQRAEAMAAAEARRAARAAAGFKQAENLIEAIRDCLDLEAELLRHGYLKKGDRFLYPESQTGIPGVHIMRGSDGVERVYSHHGGDPLAAGNLPSWCSVQAVDAVDVAAILDFGGDRKKALHEMAKRFGIGAKPVQPDNSEPPEHIPHDDELPPGQQPAIANRNTHQAERTWSSPVDFLTGDAGGAPALSAQHIPAALWPFVTDTAERMGVDPAAVALCALVSCAAVISDLWTVQPKRHDSTWTESARLWGAIVGDPSIMKTPVISATTRPIDKLEAEARNRHKKEMRTWRIEEAQAKADKTAAPPQPKCDRYLVEGATIEAIGEILRDDDEAKFRSSASKVLSRHDELSEFFGNLDKYKSGGKGSGDRGAYLRLYNGGRYTIDRIGRGSFAVPNWSACFLGGIQPGPIQKIARDSAEDGLLTRPMYCVPAAQSAGLDRAPDYKALERYEALFPALAAWHPAAAIGTDHVKPIALHTDAHAYREAIDDLARALSAVPDTSPRLKATFGKWPGLFARLCLTFHLIELADLRARGETVPFIGVIPERTARQVAIYMREIVLPHLMRAEAVMFTTDQSGHAAWIAGYILADKMHRITTRDIMRAYRPLKAPEARRELDAVMQALVAVGWLDPEEPSNPVKGVTAWTVNPAVHGAFAQRAEAEAARRAQAREQIAAAVALVRGLRRPEAKAAE